MLREVKVENGKLKGLPSADPRVTVFKGVPYAAPPQRRGTESPPSGSSAAHTPQIPAWAPVSEEPGDSACRSEAEGPHPP